MKIYRSAKDGELYKLYRVSPMKYTGEWLEAEHLFSKKIKRDADLRDYYPVAHR